MKTAWFVFYTEVVLSLRRSQEWLYPIGFFLIVVSLFPLAFSPDPAFLQKYFPGCIWIAALLSSLLSIQSVFAADLEEGNLEQLMLSPASFTFTMLAKLAAQWIVSEWPLILLTPLLGMLFHLPILTSAILCLSLAIGTPILTLLGSLGAALTIGLRQQGVFLGLLILPLTLPVLIFGVNIVSQSQAGFAIAGPLAFLSGLTLFAILCLPGIIAMTLRISIDD